VAVFAALKVVSERNHFDLEDKIETLDKVTALRMGGHENSLAEVKLYLDKMGALFIELHDMFKETKLSVSELFPLLTMAGINNRAIGPIRQELLKASNFSSQSVF
jgi:hypothetical protein